MITLSQVLESLLFASNRPLTPNDFVVSLKSAVEIADEVQTATFLETKEEEVVQALNDLQMHYRAQGRAFGLIETAKGWQLATVPTFAPWVRQLFPADYKAARLSPAALETLALVAYRQPITRADIEAVRGVDPGGMLQTLLDKGLIQVLGRNTEAPGRPMIYGTTDFFLEHFGLRNLDALPNGDELRRIQLPKAQDIQNIEAASGDLPTHRTDDEAVDEVAGEPTMEDVEETSVQVGELSEHEVEDNSEVDAHTES